MGLPPRRSLGVWILFTIILMIGFDLLMSFLAELFVAQTMLRKLSLDPPVIC